MGRQRSAFLIITYQSNVYFLGRNDCVNVWTVAECARRRQASYSVHGHKLPVQDMILVENVSALSRHLACLLPYAFNSVHFVAASPPLLPRPGKYTQTDRFELFTMPSFPCQAQPDHGLIKLIKPTDLYIQF